MKKTFQKILLLLLAFILANGFGLSTYAQTVAEVNIPISTDTQYDVLLNESYNENDLVFVVSEPHIGRWTNAFDSAEADSKDKPPINKNKIAMLALRYDFVNNNETKKIDLNGGFSFSLEDEFGNSYNCINKPNDYPAQTYFPSENYPSVYPGDKYAEVIFFEAPLLKSAYVVLTIGGENIGLSRPVRVLIPTHLIDRLYETNTESAFVEPKKDIAEPAISITYPPEGTEAYPGDTVNITVEIPADCPAPQSVYVVSPMDVLNVTRPLYSYQIRIPQDYKPGTLTVMVIGRWEKGAGHTIVSDTIDFEILEPKKE